MAMSADERAALDARALELRMAGVPVGRIKETLGYRTKALAEAAIARARTAQAGGSAPASVRELELDRLDRLQQAVWPKAAKGDMAAVDRVLQLSTARLRLAAVSEASTSAMVTAYDEAIEALQLTDADKAVVAAGRRLAGRIDAASDSLDAVAETKALYLIPHLMTVLRELGATPAARQAVQAAGPSLEEDELTAFRRRKGSA